MPDDKIVTTHEEALEAGYYGWTPDETPNEAYTVAGVTGSDEAAKADRKAAAGLGNQAPDPTAEQAVPAKSSGSTKKTG